MPFYFNIPPLKPTFLELKLCSTQLKAPSPPLTGRKYALLVISFKNTIMSVLNVVLLNAIIIQEMDFGTLVRFLDLLA